MPLDRQLKTLVKDRVDRSLIGRRTQAARALMLLSMFFALAAVGWWGLAGGATRGRLYSPGHVSTHHAQFEDKCEVCHEGDRAGGFRAQVTDNACIQCHDGSIHHPNQLVAKSPGEVSRETRTLAIARKMSAPHSMTRSADCASCHVEHRGDAVLAGNDDVHCLVCHADLSKATVAATDRAAGSRPIAARVVAFDLSHPKFGARLLQTPAGESSPRLVDPTRLKFNHRYHLTSVDPLKPEALPGDRSCVVCHETSNASPGVVIARQDAGKFAPPFASFAATRSQPAAAPDGRYTLPVSYERHCAGCHQLRVPDSVAREAHKDENDAADSTLDTYVEPRLNDIIAPHASASAVRDFIQGRVRELLLRPDDQFKVRTDPATKEITSREAWFDANYSFLNNDPNMNVERSDAPQTSLTSDDVRSFVDLLTLRTLRGTGGGFACLRCHDIDREAPTTSEDNANLDLVTAPTGIPAGPQRWFTASSFDHRAHRDMSCVQCHADLSATSLAQAAVGTPWAEQTSFVHSPNLDGEVNGANATRSCVKCHHADAVSFGPTSAGRGAPAKCVTCHDFHDRSLEVAVEPVATTRPATPRIDVVATP